MTVTEVDDRPPAKFKLGETIQPKDDRAQLPEFVFELTHPGQIMWMDAIQGYIYLDQPLGGIGFLESEMELVEEADSD